MGPMSLMLPAQFSKLPVDMIFPPSAGRSAAGDGVALGFDDGLLVRDYFRAGRGIETHELHLARNAQQAAGAQDLCRHPARQ